MAKKYKGEAPAVTTYADHEVITPPNKLRNAVALATADDHDPVARAEQALAQISTEFSSWMDVECARLGAARDELYKAGFDATRREALFTAAHDIKGEAATFGFPLAAAAAKSLCRLIEHTPDPRRIPLTLVDQHVDAIRAIVREHALPHAEGVAADLTIRLRLVTEEFRLNEVVLQLQHMVDVVRDQLARVLQSYERMDVAGALEVWRKDQEIDALNTALFRELLTFMMEDPRNITFCTHMLFCAKNIERMGDHATNIAETVYYIVEGSQLKEERPKADVTSRKTLSLPS